MQEMERAIALALLRQLYQRSLIGQAIYLAACQNPRLRPENRSSKEVCHAGDL